MIGLEPITCWLQISCSANWATSAYNLSVNGWRWIRTTEAICSRFTVCPLWPLGNPSIKILYWQKSKADDRTRTDNLLITNQLLCQLSHIGIVLWNNSLYSENGAYRARTYDPLLVRQMLSQLSYAPICWPPFSDGWNKITYFKPDVNTNLQKN